MGRVVTWAGRGVLGLLGLVLLLNGVGLTVWLLANRDRLAAEVGPPNPSASFALPQATDPVVFAPIETGVQQVGPPDVIPLAE